MRPTDQRAAVEAWAASGAMSLTGWPDEPPLGPPAPLVAGVLDLEAAVRRHAAVLDVPFELDALALLAERAAIEALGRGGRTSCGGATRLLRTGDGWLALSLARDDDRSLLPAWLGWATAPDGDPWPAVEAAVAGRPTAELVEWGALLGLPVASLPEDPSTVGPAVRRVPATGPQPPSPTTVAGLLVVDLTALWAGPLCASVLGALGADVVKVESTARPDGGRRDPQPSPHFHLLNAGKRSVALDLASEGGRADLLALVEAADVVVEASRPRALQGLGVDAEAVLTGGRPRVWVSITGYGRAGTAGQRVAFGDDAAVAGGLVAWDRRGEPVFCADAVADPLTGLTAAVAALDALAEGGRWLLDVSMAGVAASMAGPTLPVPQEVAATAGPARARRTVEPAADLGAHTTEVLAGLRRRR